MEHNTDNLLKHHVTLCTPDNRYLMQTGSQAEKRTVDHILKYLKQDRVGDYRILANYNMPLREPGMTGSLEVDVVVINKFGVFLLEVKDWSGSIEAYEDYWIIGRKYKRSNPLATIQMRAKILHSNLFGRDGELRDLGQVSVSGLVLLTRPDAIDRFSYYGSGNRNAIVGLNPDLTNMLSSTTLHRAHRTYSKSLSDAEIQRVRTVLYGRYQSPNAELVGQQYRILQKLLPGDLFEAFKAEDVDDPSIPARLKRYQLPSLSSDQMPYNMRLFRRSAQTVSRLDSHPNILRTRHFFQDATDVFYEVTELLDGDRLDQIMARCTSHPLSLEQQLDYLEPLCLALGHAHRHEENGISRPVFHRNLNPETVFVSRDGKVKLADFDFAKVSGQQTLTPHGKIKTLVETSFTAPEVVEDASQASEASDIYSLGVLWYFLACLPEQEPSFLAEQAEERVDMLHLPSVARSIMKQMLHPSSHKRPQTTEIVISELRKLRVIK